MKKIYKRPMSRVVLYAGEEEFLEDLVFTSWNGSIDDEGNMNIIDRDPDGDGKGVKENKNLWDEVW